MFKELKMLSLKRSLFRIIGFFVFGCIGIAMLLTEFKTPPVSVHSLRDLSADDSEIAIFVIIFLFCIFFWGMALWLLISALSGTFQKEIKKYCETSGSWSGVEQFYRSTAPVYGLRVSQDYILGMTEGVNTFLLSDDLLWTYIFVERKVKYLVVTTHQTVLIKFITKDGKEKYHSVKDEAQANEVMTYIHNTLPWVITGYSDELANIYRNNRQRMINTVNEHRTRE